MSLAAMLRFSLGGSLLLCALLSREPFSQPSTSPTR
jgi:hypothetical protein